MSNQGVLGREISTKVIESPSGVCWKGAQVTVLNAKASPRERSFSRGTVLIGAGSGADIIIDDPSVSRRHAQMSITKDGIELIDLQSRNGTYLQGQRVERLLLGYEAILRLGKAQLRVVPQPADSKPTQLEADGFGELLGTSQSMRCVFGVLQRLRSSNVPLLIAGESGTGKEVVARAVHAESPVSAGPFVAVNCGAIDRALARSELFGHCRGAFTGAMAARAGAFEQAHGGTLFLDEIGELPLDVQPVLLRTLETETVARVGEGVERAVCVRLIAATNRNLTDEVRAGRFRADLFYRLDVVSLTLPPLRERQDDIELLARHFAAQFGAPELTDVAIAELRSHSWPGNVRELRNALRGYAAIGVLPLRGAGSEVDFAAFLRSVLDLQRPYQEQKSRLLAEFVAVYVQQLLEHTKGNQSAAARIAGIERAHLNKLVKQLRERASSPV